MFRGRTREHNAACRGSLFSYVLKRFLKTSAGRGGETRMSMSATNTFKQGHAFLIKCLREWSEPMVAGGGWWRGAA